MQLVIELTEIFGKLYALSGRDVIDICLEIWTVQYICVLIVHCTIKEVHFVSKQSCENRRYQACQKRPMMSVDCQSSNEMQLKFQMGVRQCSYPLRILETYGRLENMQNQQQGWFIHFAFLPLDQQLHKETLLYASQ